MSAPDDPSPAVPRYTGGQIALILFGVILLLPGLCSLLFVFGGLADLFKSGDTGFLFGPLAPLWLFCFAISMLGIFMIRSVRKQAPRSS